LSVAYHDDKLKRVGHLVELLIGAWAFVHHDDKLKRVGRLLDALI